MRAIWRQPIRPRLTSRAVLRDSILREKAIEGLALRAPGFNDFFTVFLAPVLAAVTIVNLSWKQQQRQTWDKRIADIDREIESLRSREQELLVRLLPQGAGHGTGCQRRHFFGFARETNLPPTTEQHAQSSDGSTDEGQNSPWWTETEDLNPTPSDQNEIATLQKLEPLFDEHQMTAVDEDPILARYDRLIAYKLALRMLLHSRIGGPRYNSVEASAFSEGRDFSSEVNTILRRLQEVTSTLTSMKPVIARTPRPRPEGIVSPNPLQLRLHNQLRHLGDQFKSGRLKANSLVNRFAMIIMEVPATPTIREYTSIIHLFNYAEQEEMSYLVISALNESTLYLDKTAVHTLLWRFGRSRDLSSLDQFLRDLTRLDGKIQDPWEWRRVNGTLVPIPSEFSSLLCCRLISIALNCGQIEKAEAWASLLAEERPFHFRQVFVVKHFLLFCKSQRNWERGKGWISALVQLARGWDKMSWSNHRGDPFKEMQLTIFRMLDLALACGKNDFYTAALTAVCDAGLEPPAIAASRPQWFQPRSIRVIVDWREQLGKTDLQALQQASVTEHLILFADRMAPLIASFGQDEDPEPVADQYNKLDSSLGSSATQKDVGREHESVVQHQDVIHKLQKDFDASARTNEEVRQRLVQMRQQEFETSAGHQRQIDTLRRELIDFTEVRGSGSQDVQMQQDQRRLEDLISQQRAAMTNMQRQIDSFAQQETVVQAMRSQIASLQEHLTAMQKQNKLHGALDTGKAVADDMDSGYDSDSTLSTISNFSLQADKVATERPESGGPEYVADASLFRKHSGPVPDLSDSQLALVHSIGSWLKHYRIECIDQPILARFLQQNAATLASLTEQDLEDMGIYDRLLRRKMVRDIDAVSALTPVQSRMAFEMSKAKAKKEERSWGGWIAKKFSNAFSPIPDDENSPQIPTPTDDYTPTTQNVAPKIRHLRHHFDFDRGAARRRAALQSHAERNEGSGHDRMRPPSRYTVRNLDMRGWNNASSESEETSRQDDRHQASNYEVQDAASPASKHEFNDVDNPFNTEDIEASAEGAFIRFPHSGVRDWRK